MIVPSELDHHDYNGRLRPESLWLMRSASATLVSIQDGVRRQRTCLHELSDPIGFSIENDADTSDCFNASRSGIRTPEAKPERRVHSSGDTPGRV